MSWENKIAKISSDSGALDKNLVFCWNLNLSLHLCKPLSEVLLLVKLFLLISLPNAGEQAMADKFPPLVCL